MELASLSLYYSQPDGDSLQEFGQPPHARLTDMFDCVFVDGRSMGRPNQLQEGWSKLLPGGYMILHDAERAEYAEALSAIVQGCSETWNKGPPGSAHLFIGKKS